MTNSPIRSAWIISLCVVVVLQNRELLASGVRHPVRPLHGLLPDPDLHPVQFDCRHLLGFLLAQPQRLAGPRLPRRHHRAHHDDAHVLNQRPIAKNLLRQVHWHLPGHLLRHGLRFSIGYRTQTYTSTVLYLTDEFTINWPTCVLRRPFLLLLNPPFMLVTITDICVTPYNTQPRPAKTWESRHFSFVAGTCRESSINSGSRS